jgi:hypothetical protein
MKSAEEYLALLERGFSAKRALSCLAQCELPYIEKVPFDVYCAARWFGWRFFPVSRRRCSPPRRLRISEATDNLEQLKRWACIRPHWALATGALSGVFVIVVEGDRGRNSLLECCGDDWDWLFTLRTQAGLKRYIFYAWPDNQRQISRSACLGKGLSLLGEGDWLLYPPSREPSGAQHVFLTRSTAAQPPTWLIERLFDQESVMESVSMLSPHSGNQIPHAQIVHGVDRP